ncbi:MAG: glycosyltransferase family protein [Chloroflexota bacterium]|nr:glycosyltransferase family protein [Chloroflexota bacterium]
MERKTSSIKPKIVAIIQARRASSRLPDKVLLDIAGKPMLARVYERTRMADTVGEVVIATTTNPADDAIAALCDEQGYLCYRGSEHDVLDRYYQAACLYHADVVVRITADCPVIDPDVIDHTVNSFLGSGNSKFTIHKSHFVIPYDFAANRFPPPWGRTYPIGLDTEVCTFQALEAAWREADQPHQREHVMPFFYEHPDRFRILHIKHDPDFGSLRWTVDTASDLELIRQIFAHFPDRDDFSWLEIIKLFEMHPELTRINAQVQHKHYKEVDTRTEL